MNFSADQPIGIFDSGVGGLTVVRSILQTLPQEDLIYLGDTARVPYGNRGAQTIVRYVDEAAQFLSRHQVKMILIACNTASSAADLAKLETKLGIPVLGTIEPGVHAAVHATKRGVIGVIGTMATIRSGAYPKAIQAYDPRMEVFGQACPFFVPLIEEGWTSTTDSIATETARRYLQELYQKSKEIDTLVLGCTHYPLMADVIGQVAQQIWSHPIQLVDCASTMAQAAKHKLRELARLRKAPERAASSLPLRHLSCFVTDEARVAEVGSRFLGAPLQEIKVVSIDS